MHVARVVSEYFPFGCSNIVGILCESGSLDEMISVIIPNSSVPVISSSGIIFFSAERIKIISLVEQVDGRSECAVRKIGENFYLKCHGY